MGTRAFAPRLHACVHAVLEPLGVAALAPGQPQRRADAPARARPEPYQDVAPSESAGCALAPGQPQRREGAPAPARLEPCQGVAPSEPAACAGPAERAAPPAEPRDAARGGLGLEAGSGLCEGLAPAERAALVEAAALPALLEGAAWRGIAAELAHRGAWFNNAAVQGAGMHRLQGLDASGRSISRGSACMAARRAVDVVGRGAAARGASMYRFQGLDVSGRSDS